MDDVAYAFRKELPGTPFEEALVRVTDALKAEGFGVLTTIDVQKTLKEKINADFRPYVILGACNPHLAHQALTTDDNIGLLLPCNVVVAAMDDGSEVAIAKPEAMVQVTGNVGLESMAREAEERLSRALASL